MADDEAGTVLGGDVMTVPQPQPWVSAFLRRLGIETPDHENELHRRLVAALMDAGPGATLGGMLTAIRYVIRAEHARAGRRYALAKADYDDTVTDEKVRLQESGEKITATLAKDKAEQAAKVHHREALIAELEERSLRLFLDAIESDLDNHRTDRADQRAGDRAESHGEGGGV